MAPIKQIKGVMFSKAFWIFSELRLDWLQDFYHDFQVGKNIRITSFCSDRTHHFVLVDVFLRPMPPFSDHIYFIRYLTVHGVCSWTRIFFSKNRSWYLWNILRNGEAQFVDMQRYDNTFIRILIWAYVLRYRLYSEQWASLFHSVIHLKVSVLHESRQNTWKLLLAYEKFLIDRN